MSDYWDQEASQYQHTLVVIISGLPTDISCLFMYKVGTTYSDCSYLFFVVILKFDSTGMPASTERYTVNQEIKYERYTHIHLTTLFPGLLE